MDVMNFLALALDTTASLIYLSDYLKLLWDTSYVIDLSEVRNSQEVLPYIMEHRQTAAYPVVQAPQLVYFATAKLFLPLLLLLVLGMLAIKSMWEVVADNKRLRKYLRRV